MHGKNAEARTDKEWWGKRPLVRYTISYSPGINKFFKRLLHKIERRQGKDDIDQILKEANDN